jgi:hypothetical protein
MNVLARTGVCGLADPWPGGMRLHGAAPPLLPGAWFLGYAT